MNVDSFSLIPELVFGISERKDGSLRLHQPDTEARRRLFCEKAGLPFDRLVSADLVHGTHVHVATEAEAGKTIAACDGLVTAAQDLFLTVTGADCFPLFVVDPYERIIGIAHAGWRGIASNITKEFLARMTGLGADKQRLQIAIGPGIRACHFEVKDDVASVFPDKASLLHADGMTRIDLPATIIRQLEREGIGRDQIEDSGACTYCLEETYFSRRRDQNGPLEAMMAYIGFRRS